MNTTKSKPLAKVLGPVLLLSAALSLPVDSYAAPSPNERNAHSERADKNHRADRNERKANRAERQKRNQQQEVRQERREARSQRSDRGDERRAAGQRQAELNRQRAAERQAAAQRKADLNRQKAAERRAAAQRAEARQAELNRKAESKRLKQQQEQSRRERQIRESRQAELNRQAALQRQAELNRRAELQRQAELNRRAEVQRRANAQRYAVPRNQTRNQNRYYDRWYDRSNDRYRSYAGGRRWNQGDTIAVDGYLTDEGYSCQALRDDNGDLYMLVNHTYGLRTGDHARVVGRVVDGGYCDWEGIAFEITDVTALWADRRHQTVYYHQNYDGGRFGHRDNWLGRRPRQFQNRVERYGYYDRDSNRYGDRYRDDRYYDDDHDGKRQMIIRQGRIHNDRGCTVLESGGDVFGLTGNLRGHRGGDDVKVTGFLEGPSRCAGKTIRVGEITGR